MTVRGRGGMHGRPSLRSRLRTPSSQPSGFNVRRAGAGVSRQRVQLAAEGQLRAVNVKTGAKRTQLLFQRTDRRLK
jgi:hypothetical protein